MVAGEVSNEILSPISPSKLWKAIVKDFHNLMPDIISSIVILESNGRVGNPTSQVPSRPLAIGKIALKQLMMKNKYSNTLVIEGGLIGKNVKSTSFKLKFKDGANGGSVCKFAGDYETIEDSLPTEAQTKEMMGSMVAMFKAIEGYLIANPDVYV